MQRSIKEYFEEDGELTEICVSVSREDIKLFIDGPKILSRLKSGTDFDFDVDKYKFMAVDEHDINYFSLVDFMSVYLNAAERIESYIKEGIFNHPDVVEAFDMIDGFLKCPRNRTEYVKLILVISPVLGEDTKVLTFE